MENAGPETRSTWYGVPGYEVPGCGSGEKKGVCAENITRGSILFSPKNRFSSLK